MVASLTPHRWTLQEFLAAWDAGVFGKRTELLDGEVWDVAIGAWHAATTGSVIRALPNGAVRIMAGSLVAGESLPEPDCWVRRSDAEPIAQLSRRMSRWASSDVLLVVEVSDETVDYDLGRKADMYAQAGMPHYWCVTRHGIYAHSGPGPHGYTTRRLHGPDDGVAVPYASGTTIDVADLIAE